MLPHVTGGIFLETSMGSLVIDLWGHDCPATVTNFLGLALCKAYNGSTATTLWRNNYIEFTPPLAASLPAFHSLADPTERAKVPAEIRNQTAGVLAKASSTSQSVVVPNSRIRFSQRRGLILRRLDGGAGEAIIIVVSNSNLDYLEKTHVCFGEVTEGMELLSRFQALPIAGGRRRAQC